MKKFVLILFLIPITSYSQIIIDNDLGEIDIRNFTDKYITIAINETILPSGHLFSTSEYEHIILKTGRKKKWNVYDNGVLVRLEERIDVLDFFSKYGYKLAIINLYSPTSSYPISHENGVIIPFNESKTSLTLTRINP